MSARFQPIRDTILPVRKWNPSTTCGEGTFRYIDLSSVDNEAKEVRSVQDIRFQDAPSRARQLVESGDILVSTVRPNLNGVAKLNGIHTGGVASTGFCVLRPNPNVICPEYLFHWVRSPNFVLDMVRKATGASYPAVSDRIIMGSLIPLPPNDEQRRIAAILVEADDLRRKQRGAINRLGTLGELLFSDMFGDVVQNSGQGRSKLSSVVKTFEGGKISRRSIRCPPISETNSRESSRSCSQG